MSNLTCDVNSHHQWEGCFLTHSDTAPTFPACLTRRDHHSDGTAVSGELYATITGKTVTLTCFDTTTQDQLHKDVQFQRGHKHHGSADKRPPEHVTLNKRQLERAAFSLPVRRPRRLRRAQRPHRRVHEDDTHRFRRRNRRFRRALQTSSQHQIKRTLFRLVVNTCEKQCQETGSACGVQPHRPHNFQDASADQIDFHHELSRLLECASGTFSSRNFVFHPKMDKLKEMKEITGMNKNENT